MRELRSCEFCGDDAANAYEVLPGHVSSGPRRMILCVDCQATLESVINLLIDEVAEDMQTTESDQSGESPPNLTGGEDRTGAGLSNQEGAEGQTPSGRRNETGPAADGTTDESDTGVTIPSDEEGEAGSDNPTQEAHEAGADSGDQTTGSKSATGRKPDHGSGSDEPNDMVTGESGGRGSEPEGFRRAMRLLNNREFPVERSEFIALASGAYEMDEHQVEAIIDHAVERGVIAEDGGRLTRG